MARFCGKCGSAANEIMEKNTGEAGIEELYFTSLVIQ